MVTGWKKKYHLVLVFCHIWLR